MSDGPDRPDADDIDALDFTGPAIDTTEGIVALEGVLLALSATVMRLADEVWLESAGAVIDSGADDAPEVARRIHEQVELGERLDQCAAAHSSYDTTPGERNMIRRGCHLILSAAWTEPTGIPEQVLTALGMPMEVED